MRSAAILIVGDEVLGAEVRDTNGPFLLHRLASAAVRVTRFVMTPDDEDAIVTELTRLRALADAVVVGGGIGPTHDDVTRPAVARVLGVPLVPHPDAERRIRAYFGDRLTPADLSMARMPEGSRILTGSRTGTLGFAKAGVYVFPGVPFLFEDLAEGLLSEFTAPALHRREIVTPRSEGEIAAGLADCQGRSGDVRIGSYPVFADGRWHVRVVLRGLDPARLEVVAGEVRAALESAG